MHANDIILIPTRQQVEALQVGDLALDCFGHLNPVTDIYGRGTDIKGKHYVLFYTRLDDHGSISGGYKEGELVRTVPLCSKYTSAQLDQLEQRILSAVPAPVPTDLAHCHCLECNGSCLSATGYCELCEGERQTAGTLPGYGDWLDRLEAALPLPVEVEPDTAA
jgi:hypothetical protein